MKILKLIDLLRAHDPEGEVQGVEHLQISAPLIPSATAKKPLGHYVKGTKRLEVAQATGSAASVAEQFNIPVTKVLELRSLLVQGKLK